MESKTLQGHLSMLLATIMWGAMAPIAKGVLEEGVLDGLGLSVVRIGGGTLLFLLFSLVIPDGARHFRLEPHYRHSLHIHRGLSGVVFYEP